MSRNVHFCYTFTKHEHAGDMKQRGFAFLPFLLANWQLIAVGLLALSVFAYWKHCEYVKDDYRKFIAKLEAQGKAQEEKVRLIVEQGKKDKERADRENARLRDSNTALSRSLRDARSSARYVPPAAPGSRSPDRATFDRAELERAIQQLDAEVSGLIAEGDQARIDLDTAKAWIK